MYSSPVSSTKTEVCLPESLERTQNVSALTTRIMEDEGSGDMKIFSREKENKKVFNVHKSFFSSRFPVF